MKLIDRLYRDAPLATRNEITPKLGFLLTVLLAMVWLIPFLWMVVATLRPASDGINLMAELMPSLKPTLDNVRDAWEIGDFPRYTLNTTIICAGILLVQFV
ncbi:carbohydrate ABC transporter permease, partial [Herbaspirillum sp. HC18]